MDFEEIGRFLRWYIAACALFWLLIGGGAVMLWHWLAAHLIIAWH